MQTPVERKPAQASSTRQGKAQQPLCSGYRRTRPTPSTQAERKTADADEVQCFSTVACNDSTGHRHAWHFFSIGEAGSQHDVGEAGTCLSISPGLGSAEAPATPFNARVGHNEEFPLLQPQIHLWTGGFDPIRGHDHRVMKCSAPPDRTRDTDRYSRYRYQTIPCANRG